MTQQQLKQLLLNCISADTKQPGLFYLDMSAGWDNSVTKMAGDYFPNGKLTFSLPGGTPLTTVTDAINKPGDADISFEVTGVDYPFRGLPLVVTASLATGVTSINISAKKDNPVLSDYFPVFTSSLADTLPLTSIEIQLGSVPVAEPDTESVCRINTTLDLNKIMIGLSDLLGLASSIITVKGFTWFAGGGSLFYGIRLFSDINFSKQLGPFNVTVYDFGIMDDCIFSMIQNENIAVPFLTMSAAVSIKGSDGKTYSVPLEIDIHNLSSDLHFKADLSEAIPFGEALLESFLSLSPGDLKKNMPAIDGISDIFKLEEFGFYFNLSSGTAVRSYGSVSFDQKNAAIDIVKDFPKAGKNLSAGITAFKFSRTNYNGNTNLEIDIIGDVGVGTNGVIEVQLSVLKDHSPATNFKIFGAQKEKKEIILSEILEAFTEKDVKLPEISVHELEFYWDSSDKSWSFEIELAGDIPIPFNNPAFSIEQIDFKIANDATAYQFFLGGVFAVGSVEISISAQYADGWIFKGSTGPDQQIPFGEYIEILWDYLSPGTEHKIPAGISHLVAQNINLEIDTTNEFSFKAGIEISETKNYGDNFEITPRDANSPELLSSGDTNIELKNIKLAVERTASIKFKAEANFAVKRFAFSVAAEYNDGWSFNASLDKENTTEDLSIENLANAFGFGNPSLPDFISNLTIKDIAVSFQSVLVPDGTKPKNADKHFLISLTDETSAVSVEIDLKLNVTYNSDGENIDFSGHLSATDKKGNTDPVTNEKPKYIFDIVKLNSGNGKLLLASYHQENGADVSLKIITDALGISGGPAISIGLKDALFFRDVDSSGSNSPFDLFMADVGAGMNLSGLPLIGKVLPRDATVSLALRIIYASAAYAWGLADVNKLLPDGIIKIAVPDKTNDKKSFTLLSEIKIGNEALQLNVPVQFDSNKAPKQIQESTTPAVNSNLPAAPSPNGDVTWIKIGKKFGPVIFNRLGINYKDSLINVYPDAALEMNGLTFTLDGLSVSSPLTEFKPSFHLKGLGLDYTNGAIEIGASFLRRTIQIDGEDVDEFDGMAIIKTAKLSLSALGSYAYYKGNPSLFIYAYLNQALGGPSFFFVEGLAAAIGYNRSLIMPAINEVSSFPLVRQVMETQQPDPNISRADLLTQQLDAIAKYVPVSPGQMFFAIGIKFNSFKLIDSFVLLAISFGRYVEVDVLGQSNIIVPSVLPPNVPPLAQVKIQLMAKFLPDEGFLSVMAQVTNDSYIFSPDCHLTGGAAFYSWFKGEHEGDFVMTIGGYHPSFNVPAHYPQVPRVGFSWQVDSTISIKGDMYFALCAHAFMAGGHLEALFEDGPLKAWFRAGADFLLTWQPYHYDARMYLDIGASYTYHFFGTHHLTIDLGADVHLWGPDLAGTATLHIWIFDVDVSFGNPGNTSPQPISFDEFTEKCLPGANKIISGAITQGQHGEDKNKTAIVNAKELTVAINSEIPVYSFTGFQFNNSFTSVGFNIAPMGAAVVSKSEMSITVLRNNNPLPDEEFKNIFFSPVKKKVPAALWGNHFLQDLNTDKKTIELVTGVTITTKEPKETGATDFLELDQLLENDPIGVANVFSGTKTLNKKSVLKYDSKNPDSLCVLLGVNAVPVYS